MKSAATVLVVALLGGGLAASGALGATASKSNPWQAVTGRFKTRTAASSQVSKLSGMGFSGFRVETEKRGQFSKGKKYEVEKGFATKKSAKAEAAKLRKAGFKRSYAENEKSEKKAA